MNWFSSFWKSKSFDIAERAPRSLDRNILVISDIHLGEDILNEGPDKLSSYIRTLNQKLVEFISAYHAPSSDGRSWNLVINGDMFDFVKISLLPDEDEALEMFSRELSLDERRRGLENTAANTAWKLERILEIHRPVFKEMAEFLRLGNSVTLIEGNHDAEFYFSEVRETLENFLVKLARKGEGERGGLVRSEFVSRIGFRTWFDASPGRYHIEHGHQYDEMCSVEYNLSPHDSGEKGLLATPFSHRIMPYFAEILGDFSTHGIDKWSFTQWLRFSFSMGPRMVRVLATTYFTVCGELLFQAGGQRKRAMQVQREEHEKKLEGLMKETPYGFETLCALDQLRVKPAEYSFLKILHAFYLDRFLVGAVTVIGVIVAGFLGSGWLAWGAPLLVLMGGVGSQGVLMRVSSFDLVGDLRSAAAEIADRTGARYVIFGHSHHPELVNLSREFGTGRYGEQGFYLNSGSWVTREILDEGGGSGMTYVEITSEGASLRRWRNPKEGPEVLISSGDVGSRNN